MAGRSCLNCVYSVCDPEVWLRLMHLGEPVLASCANHPCWPGQMHEVPGVPCPNYRRKPAVPQGDVRLIPLAEGPYAYVDAADHEWLSQWNWRVCAGGYAGRHDKGKTILMHRAIMQPPSGMVVDHIDSNRANNCRFNLRVCTRQENLRNNSKRRGAYSRFKGVGYSKDRHKWYARIKVDGKPRPLGFFDNEIDAARAYDHAAVQECGEYARVNFPQEWPPERRREVYAAYQAALKRAGKKSPPKAKAEGNKRKAKAKVKKKKAKVRRKPHRARPKTKKLPPRQRRTRSRRNHR